MQQHVVGVQAGFGAFLVGKEAVEVVGMAWGVSGRVGRVRVERRMSFDDTSIADDKRRGYPGSPHPGFAARPLSVVCGCLVEACRV